MMAKTYKIKDNETGQVLEVPEQELTKYGLSAPSVEPTTQPTKGSSIPPITGHTLQEHAVALEKARQSGNTAAIKAITDNYQREMEYQKNIASGAFDTPEEKARKQAEATKSKSLETKNQILSDLKTKAQAVKKIIELGKSGKLAGEQYKTALGQAASDFNKQALFAKEDKVAGSALTPQELAQLGGGIINISSQGQSVIDRATGYNPPPNTQVKDAEDTINQKMDYILTGNPPSTGGGQNNKLMDILGQFANNAGTDTKDILNGLLNLPKSIQGGVNERIKNNQPIDIGNLVGAAAPKVVGGIVNEYNQLAGEPLKGGDVVGRIGQRAYQKPVSTILDLLPFLVEGKAGAVTKAADTGEVANVAKVAEAVNPAEKLIRNITDITSGGGSKEYISRAAKSSKAIPQNQVLLDEGILTHPTATGKIAATSKSMQKIGGQLEDIYKKSPNNITGEELAQDLTSKLTEAGYDEKAIGFIKRYISKQGEFDINKLDSSIPQLKAWRTARNLEQNPPKMLKNPESSAAYKQLSKDAARIIRDHLETKNREIKGLNAKYSALADYMDNVLKNPQGISVKGGPFNTAAQGLKSGTDALLNLLYKGANPKKLIRDMRYKQGNFQPRQ